jgi:hypothetical protein
MHLYDLPFFNTIRKLHLERYYKNYDPDPVEKIKDLHKGEKCFLLGTGPSYRYLDMSKIKSITFGTNTSYKKFHSPTYYCVSDKNVWQEHKEQILSLNTQLLLSGHAGRDFLANKDNYRKITNTAPIIFKDLGDIKRKGWQDKDLTHGTYWGNTIMVDCALQVAYWMGFKEVYLIGCECSYKDVHHFDGELYKFQKDTPRYYDKHWKKVFKAHEIIKKDFEKDGRKIYNATPGGDLEVYDRVDLEDVI